MYDIYEVVNYRRFRPYVVGNARLETLHTGMRWAEGQLALRRVRRDAGRPDAVSAAAD